MSRRRVSAAFAPAAWAEFDANALAEPQRSKFLKQRDAIELYARNASVAEIEKHTGIDRRQLYRMLDRCMATHDDGRVLGWRALVPQARVGSYQRTARIGIDRSGRGLGAAGAFGLLLQANPSLARWIDARVRDKAIAIEQRSTDDGLRVRLRGLKALHADFLRQCRGVGLSAVDYPFNTDRMGIRSLAAAARRACLASFSRSAHLAGATHLKGLPFEANSAPAALQALDVVEFDGHRLDIRLKIVVRDPLGFEQEFEIERIWLLVVIDVYSRAVLGYHVSLNSEYSRYDVIRTIEAALEPHRAFQFTLPGVGYGALA